MCTQKTRGSFLADVMVSMGILTMSITASLGILSQSIYTNSVNKNKIIAVNLAREGIEGVRLVRDTNWLRYGSNKRVCWNFWDNTNEDNIWENGSDDLCTESVETGHSGENIHPIGIATGNVFIKSYLLVLNTINYNFTLVENFKYIPENGKVQNQEPTYKTDEVLLTLNADNTPATIEDWGNRQSALLLSSRLYLDKETNLYTHFPESKNGITNTSTDFYREIFIEYPLGSNEFYPNNVSNPLNNSLDNQISITVQVWYKGHGGIMKKVVLETELTDYLERENWSE